MVSVLERSEEPFDETIIDMRKTMLFNLRVFIVSLYV